MFQVSSLGKLAFSSQRLQLFWGKGKQKKKERRGFTNTRYEVKIVFKQRFGFLSSMMNTTHILHNYSTYYFLCKHFGTAEDSKNIQSRNPVTQGNCMTLVKGANPSMQSSNYFSSPISIATLFYPEWILFNEHSSSSNLN